MTKINKIKDMAEIAKLNVILGTCKAVEYTIKGIVQTESLIKKMTTEKSEEKTTKKNSYMSDREMKHLAKIVKNHKNLMNSVNAEFARIDNYLVSKGC